MPDADTFRCRLDDAVVRPDRRETLEAILRQMFERRHHAYVTGQDKMWLTVELVQSLRRRSEVYREVLSTKTTGPLPFALGYLRIRDGALETISDAVPANTPPEALALLLSEFVEPGARLWVGDASAGDAGDAGKPGDERGGGSLNRGWRVRGVGEVEILHDETLHDETPHNEAQHDEAQHDEAQHDEVPEGGEGERGARNQASDSGSDSASA